MRVLLIEDEPDLRRVVGRVLAEEGYAVDSAANGEEGLTKAQLCDYDAIVLDLMLPRMNGWDLLRELLRRKATPVLIVTARDTLQDRVLGLDIGGDDYLVKPFELKELQARLRALIRRSSGKTQALIEIWRRRDRYRRADRHARRLAGLADGSGIRPGRVPGAAPQATGHSGDDLRPLVRRQRRYALQSDRSLHFKSAKKLGKEFIVTRRGQGYLIDA